MRRQPQDEDDLKIEDDLQNEDDLENEDDLKNEDNLKNEDEFHMINMMYVALPMRAQTEKTTLSCKELAELILYSVSLGDALTTAAVLPFLIHTWHFTLLDGTW